MANSVFVEFYDHASVDQRRRVLSFLNALSGQTEVVGASDYAFLITRPSKASKVRDGLIGWERDGLIRWTETPV